MPRVQGRGHQVLRLVSVTGSRGLQVTAQTVTCGPQLSLGFHLVNWETVGDAKTKVFRRMSREGTHSVLKYRHN